MKTFKFLCVLATAAALSACTSDELVDGVGSSTDGQETPIVLSMKTSNIIKGVQAMEATGHYNFGVFAFKTKDDEVTNIMENYLVGYMNQDPAASFRGYYGTELTTIGSSDNIYDGVSPWFYEKLGNTDYTNTDATFYTYDKAAYMSNNAKQYIKFWDFSATRVDFYAYAPYVNGASTVTFNNTSKVLSFPEISAGTDPTLNEVLYTDAAVTRKPGDLSPKFNDDVPFIFKHGSSMVRLAFYEVINGYDVVINDVKAKPTNAIPIKGKFTVDYTSNPASTTWAVTEKSSAAIQFNNPEGIAVAYNETTHQSAYNRIVRDYTSEALTNALSQSDYYNIPMAAAKNAGELTITLDFTLYSLDTNEKIIVKGATVVIPKEYTEWPANRLTTYILRITKDNNGATGGEDDPKGLYPIVFDGIEVVDLTEGAQSEWIVSQVSLSKQLMGISASADLTATLNYVDGAPSTDADKTISFSSANTGIATVSAASVIASGDPLAATIQVQPVKAGTTTITATSAYNGKSASCVVTVLLTISQTSLTMAAGDPDETLTTNAAAPGSVDWTTSDDTVATVTDGTVHAVGAGTATITATYTDATGRVQTKTCVVTVN